MGNSSSHQRAVVRYQDTDTQIVSTRGNATAGFSYDSSEASASAYSSGGRGDASSSGRTYYAEASGDGRAIATGRGAAAMSGRDNYGAAYRSQNSQRLIESHGSSSSHSVRTSTIDNTVYNDASYAAVRGNGTAAYHGDTGRAGVSVNGANGHASVKRDGNDVHVYYDGKGTAGADEDGIWAQIGDSHATVHFSDEPSCSCASGECTCVTGSTVAY